MQVTTLTPKYKLLVPVKTDPGKDNIRLYGRALTIEQMEKYILGPASKDLCAIDIETRGLTPFYPHAYKTETYSPEIVGIGLAYGTKGKYKAAYFDPRMQPVETMKHFYRRLGELYLVAHNAMFDGLWLRYAGLQCGVDVRPNWVADTLILFKDLAGGDYLGISHGLKTAQVELLGWDARGDIELDEHLISLGFYTESGAKDKRVRKPVKGEMWRVPFDILGKYCALDCISTLQLFDYIFEPVLHKYPMLWTYQDNMNIPTLQALIDQQIKGMRIDVTKLDYELTQMKSTIELKYSEFVSLPEVTPHLIEWRDLQISKIKVPVQFTKKGDVSKNYLKYQDKLNKMLADPMYCFNPASGTQLSWLFYERLFDATRKEKERFGRTEVTYTIKGVTLPATQAGAAPVDKKALPLLGPAGRKLMEVSKEIKLSEYIQSYLDVSINGCMHPGWKLPGTLTGRLSGMNPNLLQIAKDPRKLKYLLPDEGYIFCSADFSSLENVVLAELSRDMSLLYLYGPNSKPNCGYLYTGAHVTGLKEEILKYYNPNNPTQETVDLAKKKAKRERSIAKVIVLSSQYGAGVNKIHQTLNLQEIDISLTAVQHIHTDYWNLYKGVKKLEHNLNEQWERNRGYIFNGIGRPMPVGNHHLKDLVNRSCQSTGSDITKYWTKIVADLVLERKIDAHPAVYNFHDESIWNVKPEQTEEMSQVYKDACTQINSWLKSLGWICLMKVDPSIGNNLWEIKAD